MSEQGISFEDYIKQMKADTSFDYLQRDHITAESAAEDSDYQYALNSERTDENGNVATRDIVSPELWSERVNTCFDCPWIRGHFGGELCAECGCTIRIKTTEPSEKCPIGKW